LKDGRKRESKLEGYNSLEKMEIGRDGLGTRHPKKTLPNPKGFGNTTPYWFCCRV